jgi:AcrR family transcriptional regulator
MARTVDTVEDRRKEILEAALRVFAKKGFSGASNKDIAREAGITPGLIYHYFESKEALLKAIYADRSPVNIIRSMPETILALPPEEFLRFAVKQMLTGVENERFLPLMRLYLPEAIYHPELAPFMTAIIAQGSQFMEGYLAAKMETGELRKTDPALVTELLMGGVMNMVMRRQLLHDPIALKYSQDQIVESVVSLAWRGLSPG